MRTIVELTLVVLVVAIATHVGFQLTYGATPTFWWLVLAPNVGLAAYAALRLAREHELAELLRPAWGDLSKGLGAGMVLLAAAFGLSRVVAPEGSIRIAWLARLYLQFGGPGERRAQLARLGAFVVAIAVSEELVWRGFVTRRLEERVGSRYAWVYAALLYAAAHTPTLFALRDARAGLNPVLVGAALGGGLVFGVMARRVGRLPPVVLAHAFVYWGGLVLVPFWGGRV